MAQTFASAVRSCTSATRHVGLLVWVAFQMFVSFVLCAQSAHAATDSSASVHLRVVGGLAGGNLYPRFEAPFWQKTLPTLSKGQVTAEIVPFDKSGRRSNEVLRLVKLGVVPLGTMLMSGILDTDPELVAVDLAGMNPDMATLRRSVKAFRPHLEKVMRARHGIEVLALYVYPAQITFCARPFSSLADLAGRRVRISNPTQADLIRPFGAVPVQLEFAQVLPNMRLGNVDCAITGGMTGNTLGLGEVATHVNASAITWGLSVFGINTAMWNALPEHVRTLLRAELPKLEQAIWADAEAMTQEGVACNTGRSSCVAGMPGRMVEVVSSLAEDRRLRQAFRSSVLAAWVGRCGNGCVQVWNQILAPVTGVQAIAPAKGLDRSKP